MHPILTPAQGQFKTFVREQLARQNLCDADAAWSAITELGGVELVLPVAAGGLGLGIGEQCLIEEELGARLCDPRIVDGALLAADLAVSSDEDASEALEWLRRGDVSTLAPRLPGASTGTAAFAALFGGVITETQLKVTPGHGGGWTVELSTDAWSGGFTVSAALTVRVLARDRLRRAAYLLGVGTRAQQLTRGRASTRKIGGRPLIELQGPAHAIARSAVALDLARLEVWSAAWHGDHSIAANYLVPAAVAAVVDAAPSAARYCAQVHGAAATSLSEVRRVYHAAHVLAGAAGEPALLWTEAAKLRFAQDAPVGVHCSDLLPAPTSPSMAPAQDTAGSSWIVRGTQGSKNVIARIFCIPSVGLGASAFYRWHQVMPPGIEVCSLRFPGRESRLAEPAFDNMNDLVAALAAELTGWLDLPYALVGDCSGGLVVLELARRLRAEGRPTPTGLFIAACPAPQLPREEAGLHRLPAERMLSAVAEFGGLSESLLSESELVDLIEPTLRADLRLAEMWHYRAESPLNIPIVLIGGLDDRIVTPEELLPWRNETANKFSLLMVDGDHLVLTSTSDVAARLVGRELVILLDNAGACSTWGGETVGQ